MRELYIAAANQVRPFEMRSVRPLIACSLFVFASACTGSIGSSANDSTSGEAGRNGDGQSNERNPDDVPAIADEASLTCDDPSTGTSPLRRLTNPEYDNTIRDLFPGIAVGQPSVDLRFPADAFNGSFSNDSSKQQIVTALMETYFNAAEKVSKTATANVRTLLGCDPAAGAETSCINGFIDSFGLRAFRRPLEQEERSRLQAHYQSLRSSETIESALAGLISRVLLSPQFLYRIEPTPASSGAPVKLDGWQIATRLSYLLTGSMPDAELFAAAKAERLDRADEVKAQSIRLLGQAAAKDVGRRFFREWLDYGIVAGITRDPSVAPGFTPEISQALLAQADRSAEDLFFGGNGLHDLFLGKKIYANAKLGSFLNTPAVKGDDFSIVDGALDHTFGMLTNAAILTATSHGEERKMAIFRGKWARIRLTCLDVPAPPASVPALPVLDPNKTAREQLQAHVDNPGCAACHKLMDPFGYLFDNFDSVGRWRDRDSKGRAVDTRGTVVTTEDLDGDYEGLAQIAEKMATSPTVQQCISLQLFQFSTGRPATAADACAIRDIRHKLSESGSFTEAMTTLATSSSFLYLAPTP